MWADNPPIGFIGVFQRNRMSRCAPANLIQIHKLLLAEWIRNHFGIDAVPVREIGLHEASDIEIFQAARKVDAIVIITKDAAFPLLPSSNSVNPG
jgi:hypothetical protein